MTSSCCSLWAVLYPPKLLLKSNLVTPLSFILSSSLSCPIVLKFCTEHGSFIVTFWGKFEQQRHCGLRVLQNTLMTPHDASDHRRFYCLFNKLLRPATTANQSPALLPLREGNPPVTDGFPWQRSVMRKVFPCRDIIMTECAHFIFRYRPNYEFVRGVLPQFQCQEGGFSSYIRKWGGYTSASEHERLL